MNWDLCIVCQTVSSEKLRCPAKSASDQTPADVYSAFLENVEKFKDLRLQNVRVFNFSNWINCTSTEQFFCSQSFSCLLLSYLPLLSFWCFCPECKQTDFLLL